jgi:putative glutamine amidotransferase
MSIRIAIPEPTSPQFSPDAIAYNQRSLPQYLHALHSAGATPILIPLHESQQRVAKLLATVQGIVLPGSGADIDPQKYGETRLPACENADPARSAVDELLIQDAFNLHKPILAICFGAQALNVWCGGTLYQDIPSQIETATPVDHTPGRQITQAHSIQVHPGTRLAALLSAHPELTIPESGQTGSSSPNVRRSSASPANPNETFVNSSHHQAIRTPGDKFVVSAHSPQDGVIEAVELDSPDHFVMAIQWHPERTYDTSGLSRALFSAFVDSARSWTPRKIEESVLHA